MSLLDKVIDVDIDQDGDFKYVLIELEVVETNETKVIVRGYDLPYHADIVDRFEETLGTGSGMTAKCPGGGRIQHLPKDKKIKVYGLSEGYGKADHTVARELLKKAYPDYSII